MAKVPAEHIDDDYMGDSRATLERRERRFWESWKVPGDVSLRSRVSRMRGKDCSREERERVVLESEFRGLWTPRF